MTPLEFLAGIGVLAILFALVELSSTRASAVVNPPRPDPTQQKSLRN